jgi:murein DD-endopeptidase MepM/ murein hydrolase activator NlpD
MKKKTKLEKLKTKFKFQAIDETSFEEKFSIRTSWMQVWSLLLFFSFLMGVLTFVVLTYTPLNYLLPSWRDQNYYYQYRDLLYQIDSLDNKFNQQNLFLSDLQKWLSGEPFNDQINIDSSFVTTASEKIDIQAPPADSMLRKEMADVPLVRDHELERYIAKLFLSPPLKNSEKIDPFDYKTRKYGIDIWSAPNSLISSIAEGTVIQADFSWDDGYVIYIQHANNLVSVYKNNSQLLKKIGDVVSANEPIAIIGENPEKGAYLHFQLWDNGTPIDPQLYISF